MAALSAPSNNQCLKLWDLNLFCNCEYYRLDQHSYKCIDSSPISNYFMFKSNKLKLKLNLFQNNSEFYQRYR